MFIHLLRMSLHTSFNYRYTRKNPLLCLVINNEKHEFHTHFIISLIGAIKNLNLTVLGLLN